MEIQFKQTCMRCPEQYDVLDKDDKLIGYVRLRWGHLTLTCPDVNGKDIYEHEFKDNYKGGFDTQEEREKYLEIIKKELEKDLKKTRMVN